MKRLWKLHLWLKEFEAELILGIVIMEVAIFLLEWWYFTQSGVYISP